MNDKILTPVLHKHCDTDFLTNDTTFGYSGGTFNKVEIQNARSKNIPLTMDCALPGTCLNNCTYCGFLNVNKKEKLQPKEIIRIFEEFKELGGKSIKILGEGEPLLRNDIFILLENINDLGLIPVPFTCGDILGSEELAWKIHKRSCDEITEILYDIGATIILKYEKKKQDHIVQRKGYSDLRNQALKRLIHYGFNKHNPTRLGLAIVVLKENYNEIPFIFEFALNNNIYPLVCPLMPIGKMKESEVRNNFSPKPYDIFQLSKKLIKIREQKGIKFLDASDFPGGLPCDISRAGMYMDDIGNIKICESDDIVGNVRDLSLSELWRLCSEMKNRKYKEFRWKGLCFPKRNNRIILS